jgi:hypothetical protein
MPYTSKAQMRYFNEHRKEMEAQGVDVDEWNKATKDPDKLPEHVKGSKSPNAKKKAYTVDQLHNILGNINKKYKL